MSGTATAARALLYPGADRALGVGVPWRWHVRLVVAGALVVALTTISASHQVAAAALPDHVVVSARDTGDVRILRHNKGLTRAERTTADLRKVTIEQVAERRFRITVKLRHLAASHARWDQTTIIGFTETRGDWPEAGVVLQQHRDFKAFAYRNSAGTTCSLKLTRSPTRRTLSVVVPKRCMPPEGWQGWVKTSTEIVDEPVAVEPTWTVFSRDFMRLPKVRYR